jgi:outer membrane receptor for ferrienterochelin and colicin
MRFRNIALMFLMLALAMPAFAQEQRASIEGIVKDATGAVMPGVTVEAKNEAVGVVVTAVTDANGVYRFPALGPGIYDMTATLSGFNTASTADVPLTLGQIKKVDFTLSVAGVAESVQVTAESPLVDVKQSARSTSIRNEQIDLLPKGRDFSSLVTQAPGANNEGKLGGLSIDGASAGENRYIIDGIETTNVFSGAQGKNVITDFVEEVQVKSSGYTAEYGGATGGVVNVVTKSGSNNIRGNALFNWTGDALESGNRPVLRRGVLDNSKAEYQTYPEDDYTRIEPGIAVGGPLLRDKMWFFGAYQPALISTTRTVNAQTSGNPNSSVFNDVEQKQSVQYVSANTTAQIGNSIRTRVSYNNSWSKTDGRLPAQAGTTLQLALLDYDTAYPNWSLSANLDWVATPSLYFGFRGGYYISDTNDTGVPDEIRYLYSRGNVGQAGVPASFQHAANYSNVFTNNSVEFDKQTRAYFQTDATFYVNAAGQHTFKGGLQFDRVGNEVLSGEQKNLVRLQWGSSLSGMSGAYGYYQVRSNGSDPSRGFTTDGSVSTNNIGLFFQDAWTVNNKLTINAGIRTEQEKVPTYIEGDPNVPKYAVEWGFGDKLAPRLGFAYDIKGDGRWKAYGSWGIFYDIFKLELPRGSWGGDKWLEYYYTLDTYTWDTLTSASGCPPACSGTLIRGPIDFRHVGFGSDYIEPDLKPMKSQELSFGLEHQLSPVMAVSARYVRKWLDRAVEDTGSLDAQGNEIYIIANPGFGLTELAWTNPNVNQPKAKRDYDSVEFAFTKNFSQNWYLRASYLWSRLYGNYSGLSQSDENGRTSPNVGRAFDYPIMSFDENGQPVYGLLATDRPNQFKAQFIYQLPFGTSIGINQSLASGIPVTREIGVLPTSNFPVQYQGRVSDGRMPMYSQTDLSLQHAFRLGGAKQLQLEANISNLFNQRTATNRFVTMHKTNGISFDESLFYQGKVDFDPLIAAIPLDPRFLMDSGFQAPIQLRLGVRFLF